MSRGEGQRERERKREKEAGTEKENKPEAGSVLSTELNVGLDPMTLGS